ncbi:uncharacterized protein LOC130510885 [Raphanus sativus]|nr:uncharacterized protein LOC130510885 [Raphanus sativus]
MGEIQDPVIREVIEMVESQKEAFLASQQPLSDDDSTGASNNMSRLQINELVEKAVPKKKGSFGRVGPSCFFMSDFFISSPVRRSIDSRAATEQGSTDWSIGGAECYNPC